MKSRQPDGSAARFQTLRRAIQGLTRYIVDANPDELLATGADVIALTDYALAAEAAGFEPGEKVEAFGSRNLVGDSLPDWQMQMLAIAASVPRMRVPMIHIILSLRENERWTAVQREEAIDIVTTTLDLAACALLWLKILALLQRLGASISAGIEEGRQVIGCSHWGRLAARW